MVMFKTIICRFFIVFFKSLIDILDLVFTKCQCKIRPLLDIQSSQENLINIDI